MPENPLSIENIPADSKSGISEYNIPKVKLPLKILIGLFWIIQFWTTPYMNGWEYFKMNYNPLFGWLDRILQEDSLLGKRFALLEVILYLLLFLLIKNYGRNNLSERFSKRIFIVSLIVVIFCFINPNNSLDELKYFLSYEPRILIFFMIALYVFMSIPKEGLIATSYYFILYGMIVGVSQAVVSTSLFLTGNGVKFLGSTTTIPHSEIVNVMVIFSAISLSFYMYSHRKLYLFLVVLFHITIFFADRRTPLSILMIIDLMILYYYRKTGSRLLIRTIAVAALFILIIYILNINSTIDIEYFMLRIYAVFGGKIQEYGDNFTDMGHWEQTSATFATLFTNMNVIWGGGLRNYMFYVAGQSGYIHNSFVAVWAYYGLAMTLYLFYSLFIFTKRSFMYLRESKKDYSHVLMAPIAISYMMILAGDAFTGEYFSKHFVYSALFVLVLALMRLDEKEEKYIYKKLLWQK